MAKELSPSRKLAAKVLFATFKILKDAGGKMRNVEVVNRIRETVSFTEWETERYEKTGYIRWESILAFFSIDCIKTGFLQKSKGIWILTPDGEQAIKLGPEGVLEASSKGYKIWKSQQQVDESLKEVIDIKGDSELNIEQQQIALLNDYEGKAYEGLRQHVLNKNPYEFQDLGCRFIVCNGLSYFPHGK
ncbi:winged helix-turn-helix domain-containing protein [Mucilaginibacter sp. HMF5004]|uniref:winged helix-turn-helix domain-containing protein n=1 Tax=Mucilaginibacter rivuli TaxID=2857527 RepID=UPI001C60620A|nr:winged helix-turn-helix domain-containing protein [Mucilaginibacter rivuli]MBW4891567.1 winged helix-turn-helix domain-containing protein [Mucilaginibacter rivuli]